ncbi:ankyrin [Byssothecium circinans]|uniref:Ankyrin n=1 Tax=Byssothecium circinans TaxID=147558 RepID=A0A6A5TWF4_9PLEO|nr:ankyrin [Byssothecium circinans]
MAPTRRSKIPEAKWEANKSIIERLIRRDKRKLPGDDGIIDYMRRHHDFDASESQYENRFRKWGFRKKLNKVDWLIIANILRERESRGLESEVHANGERLQAHKVRKETSRRRGVLDEDEQQRLKTGQLPPSIEIRSPESRIEPEERLPENVASAANDSGGSAPPEGFPAWDEELVGSDGPLALASDPSNTFAINLAQSFYNVMDQIGCEPIPMELAGPHYTSPTALWQEFNTADVQAWTDPTDGTNFLSLQYVVLQKLRSLIPADTLSLFSLPELISSTDNEQALSTVAVSAEVLNQAINTIIPARHASNLANMSQGVAILHVAIHELVNNHMPLGVTSRNSLWLTSRIPQRPSKPVEWALAYLQHGSQHLFKRLDTCLRPPYSQALYLNLFAEAFRVRAFQVIIGLLRTSPTPEALILSQLKGKGVYDLLYALTNDGQPELVRLVIENCDERSKKILHSKLQQMPVYMKLSIENVKILLSGGLRVVGGTLFENLSRSGDLDLIKSLINQVPPSRPQTLLTWISKGFFSNAIRSLSEEDALWVIRKVGQSLQSTCPAWSTAFHPDRCVDASKAMANALQVGVAREYVTVVDFLLSAGVRATSKSLYEGVRAKRSDLLMRLLDAGASSFGLIDSSNFADDILPWNFRFRWTTPYAEAIRTRNSAAIDAFHDRSETLSSGFARLTLIVAASESGNQELLSRFLQPIGQEDDEGDWPDPNEILSSKEDALNEAFADAIDQAQTHGYKNILAMLCRARGVTNVEAFEEAIQSRNNEEITDLFERTGGTCPFNAVLLAMDCGDRDFFLAVLDCIDFSRFRDCGRLLAIAIERDDATMVQDLLRRGVGVDSPLPPRDSFVTTPMELMETPLIVAIQHRNKQIIQLLLDNKASLNPRTDGNLAHGYYYFVSALEAAASIEDTELITKFVDLGAEPYDCKAIMKLEQLRDRASIEKLLEACKSCARVSRGRRLWPAFVEAAQSDNLELVYLLKSHVELNEMHAMKSTLFSHNWETKLNALGVVLQRKCSLNIMRALLNSGSDPEALSLEINRESQDDSSVPLSYTPLNNAVLLNSIPHIDLLVEYGANVNRPATNSTKRTTLQLAVERGHADVVAHLIKIGADVNAPAAPCQGFTALQLAAKSEFIPIAELLLENGACVNAPAARIRGRTAFEAATELGRFDLMSLLVRNGADLLTADGERQFERAIKFAEAQNRDPAIKHAHDLKEKLEEATSEVEQSSFGMPAFDFGMME